MQRRVPPGGRAVSPKIFQPSNPSGLGGRWGQSPGVQRRTPAGGLGGCPPNPSLTTSLSRRRTEHADGSVEPAIVHQRVEGDEVAVLQRAALQVEALLVGQIVAV